MTTSIRRRSFLTLLGGAAAAWPLAARAQQPAMPVVGYLHPGSPETNANGLAAFRKGLSEAGFVEGRNVAFEFCWAHSQFDRLPELAADLVRRRVSVIAASGGTIAALAAKAATDTIPIVFGAAVDPVQTGLVENLNRPGGNLTGYTDLNSDLLGKRLGLLHELLPKATRFAVLVNPTAAAEGVRYEIASAQAAALAISGQMDVFTASTSREIDAVFTGLVEKRSEGLLVMPQALFTDRRVQLVTLASRVALPTVYIGRTFAEAGGLMSYGPTAGVRDHQIGLYVGRILKDEKPAELPIMRPTKFEFVINLQTARTLGIEVPPTLLAIADEVIE